MRHAALSAPRRSLSFVFFVSFVASFFVFFVAMSASAQSPAATLAPTGTLRAVFLGTNPVHGRVDPQTGTPAGPVPDLVKELAGTIGVPYTVTPAPDAAGVIAAVNAHQADIGFLAYDVSRAREVEFGAPFIVMFNSYVVRAGSPIRSSGDVDRAGVTVAAVKGQTQELFVSSHIRSATIRVFQTMPAQPELERLLTSGEVDAFAVNRQRALDAAAASPRLVALPDSFLEVDQSFVVAKGDRAKLPIIETFVDRVRSSGFIKQSIDRAKLAGVDVARKK
jgi:polar amino acid transport system substrate-binding protein